MRSSSGWFFGVLVSFVLTSAGSRADDNPPVPAQTDVGTPDIHIELQALVNTLGFHTINRFCVIAYKEYPDEPYVYWPTQNKFILVGFGSDSILTTTHYWDLTRDTAPEGPPPEYYSTSPVKALIDSGIQDCRARGMSYTIKKTAVGWVPIDKFAAFSNVKTQLQYLVDHNASKKVNSFCVIGQKDGTFLAAYVYWKTMDQLNFWLPSPFDKIDPFSVEAAPVQIDLRRSLRNEEDAEDNRNEMQRSYAEAILEACKSLGQNFTVIKSN